jgi:hypothetical protein
MLHDKSGAFSVATIKRADTPTLTGKTEGGDLNAVSQRNDHHHQGLVVVVRLPTDLDSSQTYSAGSQDTERSTP